MSVLGRYMAAVVVALMSVGFMSLSNSANAEDLRIVSWGGITSDAYREAMWKPFEKATGIHIVEDAFNGSLGQIRAQVQSNTLKWDIAEPETPEAREGCLEGLFSDIDQSKLDESQLIAGTVAKCSVVSLFFSIALTYNTDKFKEGPKTWADLWNVKKFPGKRGMHKDAIDALLVALLADGVKPDKVFDVLATKKGQDRAFRKLDELKPYIVWWTSGTQLEQGFIDGTYNLGMAWNGRIADANSTQGAHLKMVWKAGHLLGANRWVILKGTPHYDAAMKFLSFATQAGPQAEMMRQIAYSDINKDAYGKLDDSRLSIMPTSPEHLPYAIPLFKHADFTLTHEASLSERFNHWVSK